MLDLLPPKLRFLAIVSMLSALISTALIAALWTYGDDGGECSEDLSPDVVWQGILMVWGLIFGLALTTASTLGRVFIKVRALARRSRARSAAQPAIE